MQKLLLIPLDDTVIFPTMDLNLPVDATGEERVLLVPRKDGEYAKVGTIANVTGSIRLPGGARGASLESLARGVISGSAQSAGQGRLRVAVTEHPDDKPVDKRTRELEREYRAVVEEILEERGADQGSVTVDYRAKITEAGMPDAVREQAERELDRLERMGGQSGESSMIRTYLDWLTAVPWSKHSDEVLDPVHAREVLDADHAGLEDVKDRITEYIAVRKLREERGVEMDRKAGAILTLIGPPGTGKTSIGESIARATGRE